jgi:predicted molibdopterin-dependent oxidoreductase YjgC
MTLKVKDQLRVKDHPILDKGKRGKKITISVDGNKMEAIEGEPIAAALMANGIRIFRRTRKRFEPRGVFCAIGLCTDCIMTVDGVSNVRTCVTMAKDGMDIRTGRG